MMSQVCRIIGVLDNGAEGITPQALQHIQQAEVIIGGTRVLQLFSDSYTRDTQLYDLTTKLMQVPEWIQQGLAENRNVVVLATGDPMCHGLGRFLINRLGLEQCEIIPNVSTIQMAFARLGLSWQDIKICSVHSKDAGEWLEGAAPSHGLYKLLQMIRQHDTLAVLTSPENTPARIARMLQIEGLAGEYVMHIVSSILKPDESIVVNIAINDVVQQDFPELNVVVIQAREKIADPVMFGMPDNSFQQRKPDKGLITKREVRAVSLANMQLRRNSVVWDIGAGSGAVGIEAARLCVDGHVYAIEKNEADAANALVNKRQMQVSNYTLINCKAPEGLNDWDDPDAVFIGGSGGELAALIELCLQRLQPNGHLVMNFVTFENLHTATGMLKQLGVEYVIVQLNAARSQPILNMQRLAAENPVWIVTVCKGKN